MSSPIRLLLVTSNGAGMGHMTRMLSVGLAAGERAATTMMSLSVALPVVARHGIAGEYCPSVERGWMPTTLWHGYLRDRLVALAREIDADVIAFDGVAPYPGLGMARPMLPDVAFVWVRRGMWRPGVNAVQLKKSSLFDLIVEPGEIAHEADRGATAPRSDSTLVPPISMLEVVEPLPRSDAAAALGVDPDRPSVLVTLGSGRVGEIASPGAVVIEALLESPEWQICVTKPDIAEKTVPLIDRNRVVELRGVYPLVRYLRVFDAVVSAAGYNAVHEFIPAALPTLLVPNPATRTDDQVGRAAWLGQAGLALTARPSEAEDLGAAARRLADEAVRRDLAAACLALPDRQRLGGGAATAELLVALGADYIPRPPTLVERYRRMARSGRERLKDVLGPRGVEIARRILRRPAPTDVTDRLDVRVVTRPHEAVLDRSPDVRALMFGEHVPDDLIRNGEPVEHVLPGTSVEYAAIRRAIIDEYYNVVRVAGEPSSLS